MNPQFYISLSTLLLFLIYILLKDVIYPRIKRSNRGNPIESNSIEKRVRECEMFVSSAEERWAEQRRFNERIEARLEKLEEKL